MEAQLLAGGATSLTEALSILRHYSLDPTAANEDVVCRIIIMAMMRSDTRACVSLIGERIIASSDKISSVLTMAAALDSSSFVEFWALANTCKQIWSPVPGFLEDVRDQIAHVLSISFYRIKASVLSAYLNIEVAAVNDFVKGRSGWRMEGDLVILPKSTSNTMRTNVNRTQELISLASISPALRSVTVGF